MQSQLEDVPVLPRTLPTIRGPVEAISAGDTGTAVVFCAGIIGSREDFRPVLPLVARAGFRGYAYDYRGHYAPLEPASAEHHTVDRHAEDLVAVLAAVDGGAPVHLVGHSLGGFIARRAALERPDLVRSLALVGSGPAMDGAAHRRMLAGFEDTLDRRGCEVMWPIVRRLIPSADNAQRTHWRTRLDTMQIPFLQGALRSLSGESDRSAELRTLSAPTLLVHGSRDKRLWSPEEFAAYAERAGAELAVIADASHSPSLEHPDAFVEALLRLWRTPRPCSTSSAPVSPGGEKRQPGVLNCSTGLPAM